MPWSRLTQLTWRRCLENTAIGKVNDLEGQPVLLEVGDECFSFSSSGSQDN